MKFFGILLVICALAAGLFFAYDPYIKPLMGGKETAMTADGRVLTGETAKPAANTPKPVAKPATPKPEPKPVASKPAAPKPVAKAPKPEPKSEIDQLLEKRYPMPEIIPLMDIVKNWTAVPANAYPKEVAANVPVPFDLIVNGQKIGSSSVAPGSPLKPVRLSGDVLVIANVANPAQSSQVKVENTDFKQRITKRYNDFVAFKTNQIQSARAKAKAALEANPSLLASLTGQQGPADDSGDPRFGPVKASIKAGECPSVTLEEAKTFKWNGSETVRGDYPGTYDTVTVHFEVATIFGKFPVDCKALIQGGRVKHWIDPITEERID